VDALGDAPPKAVVELRDGWHVQTADLREHRQDQPPKVFGPIQHFGWKEQRRIDRESRAREPERCAR
jgi:hypothetical protein